MAIQIGKYGRPGIFIEESDQSVISSPTVTGISNTVIGVSRKGPVNTPILIDNLNTLESVFGPLDRQLERKGSFFHRTVSKMLEASPVYAINLLITDDVLDTIEYQSLSCATTHQNDIERLGPYRRFFDTTGFWKRDTESFLNLADDNVGYENRLLNFTNLSDKYVTIFVVKSQRSGFDVPMIEWYGSQEDIPPYVNNKDLVSDYLVDVVIVAGDYSNYTNLAVDARFSQYFSATGLRKDQLRNFANDRNITTLAYEEGLSMIPYFRDRSGRNIFIETVVNRGTDQHGVFCAFNIDLFETDYPKGLVDLIGNNMVRDNLQSNPPTSGSTNYGELDANDGTADGQVNIDFLSYNETITESVSFTQKILDRPGNVMGLFGTQAVPSVSGNHAYRGSFYGAGERVGGIISGEVSNPSNRTWWFSEGYVNDLSATVSVTGATLSVDYTVDATSGNGYAVIGGESVTLASTDVDISSDYYPTSTSTQSYVAVSVVDSSGTIKSYQTTTPDTNPLVSASDIVLGYVTFSVSPAGSFIPASVNNVDVSLYHGPVGSGDTNYKPLIYGVGNDYYYDSIGADSFRVVFENTNQSITPRNYELYRRLKHFNNILAYVDSSTSDKGSLMLDPLGGTGDPLKSSLSFVDVTDITNTNLLDRSFVLNFSYPVTNPSSNYVVEDDYVDNYFADITDAVAIATNEWPLIFYKIDDELILGTEGAETKATPAGLTMGVVGKYSNLYEKYDQGLINSTDVIYQKTNYSPLKGEFVPGESVTASLAGYDYLVFGVNLLEEDPYGNQLAGLGGAGDNNIDLNQAFLAAADVSQAGTGYQFLITGVDNQGTFTVKTDEGLSPDNPVTPYVTPASALARAVELSTLSGGVFASSSATYSYYAYEVNENVTEELLDVNNLYAFSENFEDKPLYVDMYMDNELNMKITFEDPTLQTIESFGTLNGGSGDPNALLSNNNFFINSFDSNFKQSIEIEEPSGWTPVANKILARASRYTELKVGDYLEASFATSSLASDEVPRKLTRVLSKRLWASDTTLVEVTCDDEIKIRDFGDGDKQTFRYTNIDDYVSTYKAISLKGFRIRQDSMPDGTEDKQDDILNLVAKGTPLFKAVTNKEAFDFRYLIDSFGLGLTERSKQQLVDICGERLDALGILNMPSMRSFKNSSSPSFVDSDGVLQTEFIASGGDPNSSPAFLYSFGDGIGVSSVGYFGPYMTVNDNGRPTDVPASAFVGLTYMRKHTSTVTNIVPWTIAAGITNGRITNIAGLEQDFNPEDITNLNGAKMNPIVFKRNRGYIIETENTAQTLYESALSFLHVREVLIELERELTNMLLDFQWKFNTPEIRAEIKLRADVICESYKAKGGLYAYFNKCDAENNTNEIIDNQIGVLDTYVEPIKGMGIIVNNVNVLRTGAIQSGGFIQS
jgi:hypothetical protein